MNQNPLAWVELKYKSLIVLSIGSKMCDDVKTSQSCVTKKVMSESNMKQKFNGRAMSKNT
jgi:hypothetical protein